jgi:hypothetical protein
MMNSGRMTLGAYDITPPMDPQELDITFPSGTRVNDETSGTEMLYVMRANGAPGGQLPTASLPSYEDLQ